MRCTVGHVTLGYPGQRSTVWTLTPPPKTKKEKEAHEGAMAAAAGEVLRLSTYLPTSFYRVLITTVHVHITTGHVHITTGRVLVTNVDGKVDAVVPAAGEVLRLSTYLPTSSLLLVTSLLLLGTRNPRPYYYWSRPYYYWSRPYYYRSQETKKEKEAHEVAMASAAGEVLRLSTYLPTSR